MGFGRTTCALRMAYGWPIGRNEVTAKYGVVLRIAPLQYQLCNVLGELAKLDDVAR